MYTANQEAKDRESFRKCGEEGIHPIGYDFPKPALFSEQPKNVWDDVEDEGEAEWLMQNQDKLIESSEEKQERIVNIVLNEIFKDDVEPF